MEEALIQALLAHAGLGALVAGRITWVARPQASGLPAVTLQVISAPRDYTLRERESLVGALVQIDCWAGSYDAAKLTARAVMAALDGLKVEPFLGAFVETERDTWEAGDGPQSDSSTDFYRTSLDVRVWFRSA